MCYGRRHRCKHGSRIASPRKQASRSCRRRRRAGLRLTPGHAGIYQDGKIHSIDYPDKSIFIRVTGTNLDRITRKMFNLETGKVTQMTPQATS
jgi:hypothetical protein